MQVGAKVLLDCSQSVPAMPVDVQSLGADWIVATGHKMCGPTGIGFVWGRCCSYHTHLSSLLSLTLPLCNIDLSSLAQKGLPPR